MLPCASGCQQQLMQVFTSQGPGYDCNSLRADWVDAGKDEFPCWMRRRKLSCAPWQRLLQAETLWGCCSSASAQAISFSIHVALHRLAGMPASQHGPSRFKLWCLQLAPTCQPWQGPGNTDLSMLTDLALSKQKVQHQL